MADVIARLRLESGEYDSKIKRATQGLLQMEQEYRKVGGTLAVLEDDQKKYVQALGRMETVSTTVKGKLGELTQAYTELSVQYKRLTAEEKKGDFGKALSSSLQQIKGRIDETRGQLGEVSKELGSTGSKTADLGGLVDMLAGKFGLSTKALGGWGAALAAVSTAVKVGKDAFMEMETNVDALGETVRTAQDIYGSFLQTLNNGDFSGFLSGIGDVIMAAREAYNAIDELNTRGTIRTPERARLQARQTELKATIRREGANSEAGKAAQQELKELEKSLTQAFKNESKDNYRVFKSLVDERLRSAGITLDKNSYNFLMKSFSNEAAYDQLRKGAKGNVSTVIEGGEYGDGLMRRVDSRNTNQKLLDLFTDEWRKENQSYLTASYQSRNSAASVLLSDARYLRGGGSGGGGGKTGGAQWAPIAMGDVGMVSLGRSVSDVTKDLHRAQQDYNEAGDMFGRAAAMVLVEKFQEELAAMKGEGDSPFADAYKHDFQKDLDELEKVDGGEKKEKREVKMSDALGDMAGGISSMVGGLEQLGVDVPEGLKSVVGGIQGVVSILTGISTILSVIEAVSSADAISPFARGGIVHAAGGYRVPGNRMSGDRVPALLNSGELVLNMAQQGNLASQLASGGGGLMEAQPYVDGEKVFLGMNAHTRRTGNGEIVTTRMLRNYGLIKG